ncbi:MAG TPA: hypothetical protein VMY37_14325 [Thermoguttaceae bacterium]|nr:hypothetical protein [Thermoguttaceae bacterium]
MAGSEWDEENPYASPRSLDGGTGQPRGERHPNVFAIEPWIARRDWIDFGLYVVDVLLGFLGGVVLSLPTFLLLLLLDAPWFPEIVAATCILTYLLALFLLLAVAWQLRRWILSRLLIDASGIAFERRAGQPRFLRWSEICVVRPATRREVLLRAWLWPWSFSREPSKTKSTLGHYRIEWADGYVFFPPKDPALFENAIRKFRPELLVHE